jgi:putative DNA primase/helicase
MTGAALLDAALSYAERRGWPVFPVALVKRQDGKLDKKPLVKWGAAATTDAKQIKEWWRRWPNALVGVPTGRRSGLVVLDVDCKFDTANGFHTLADRFALYDFPDTPQVFTRSGGHHVYFGAIDAEIRNSSGETGLGPGLDVRGEGGVVVVPSPGSGYAWHSRYNFDTVQLMPAPAWLGHRERPERTSSNGYHWFDPQECLAEACQRIRTAADGQKHVTLNREVFSVGTLAAAGLLPEADARRSLEAATSILIRHSDADRKRTWETFKRAFDDGLAAPRRVRR